MGRGWFDRAHHKRGEEGLGLLGVGDVAHAPAAAGAGVGRPSGPDRPTGISRPNHQTKDAGGAAACARMVPAVLRPLHWLETPGSADSFDEAGKDGLGKHPAGVLQSIATTDWEMPPNE